MKVAIVGSGFSGLGAAVTGVVTIVVAVTKFALGAWMVLAILPVHGMIRARVKRFGQGKIAPVPEWQWSLLLAGVMATIVLASTKMQM